MSQPGWSAIFQIAWVVPDIEAAIAHWTTSLGVGPFFVIPKVEHAQATYRGRPVDLAMRVAWAFSGPTNIELIQPLDDGPSMYRDFLQARPEGGQQHVGVWVDDMAAMVAQAEARGQAIVQAMEAASGARVAYLDTQGPLPGTVVELIERHPAITSAFEAMRAAADSWDGRDPVRRLG